jgi:methionine salvage enolase-phosphatase E1
MAKKKQIKKMNGSIWKEKYRVVEVYMCVYRDMQFIFNP